MAQRVEQGVVQTYLPAPLHTAPCFFQTLHICTACNDLFSYLRTYVMPDSGS